jgi:curli biogenesis system outer membrane secretion channel CsgG
LYCILQSTYWDRKSNNRRRHTCNFIAQEFAYTKTTSSSRGLQVQRSNRTIQAARKREVLVLQLLKSDLILLKALEDSKWFIPIERENIGNLLQERNLIRSTRQEYIKNTDPNEPS